MSESDRTLYQAVRECCLEQEGTVEEDGRRKAVAMYRFDAGFPGFDGHFPDKPVLPAVIQLAAVRCTVEKALDIALGVVGYSKVKFKGMVTVGEKLLVTARFVKEGKLVSVQFSLAKSDGESVAVGECRLIIEGDRGER